MSENDAADEHAPWGFVSGDATPEEGDELVLHGPPRPAMFHPGPYTPPDGTAGFLGFLGLLRSGATVRKVLGLDRYWSKEPPPDDAA